MMSLIEEDADCSSYSRQKAFGGILGAGMMGDAAGAPRGA